MLGFASKMQNNQMYYNVIQDRNFADFSQKNFILNVLHCNTKPLFLTDLSSIKPSILANCNKMYYRGFLSIYLNKKNVLHTMYYKKKSPSQSQKLNVLRGITW